jgi:hypothetical protein
MADYIYCGTDVQVGAANTASLLASHQAIWCPNHRLRPWHVTNHPSSGDRMWLAWSAQANGALTLLGGGRVQLGPKQKFGSAALWTDRAARQHAKSLGYSGPTSMSFLKLDPITMATPTVVNGMHVASGLSELSQAQSSLLAQMLTV